MYYSLSASLPRFHDDSTTPTPPWHVSLVCAALTTPPRLAEARLPALAGMAAAEHVPLRRRFSAMVAALLWLHDCRAASNEQRPRVPRHDHGTSVS